MSIAYAHDRLSRYLREHGANDVEFQRLLQDYGREVYFAACEDAGEVLHEMTFAGVQARQDARREQERAEQ